MGKSVRLRISINRLTINFSYVSLATVFNQELKKNYLENAFLDCKPDNLPRKSVALVFTVEPLNFPGN